MHRGSSLSVIAGFVVLILTAGCGPANLDSKSALRTTASLGNMALESDGTTTHVLVNLNTAAESPSVCAGGLASCVKGNGTLIALSKTEFGYLRSAQPLNIQKNLTLHVISGEGSARKALLSVVLRDKNDQGLNVGSDIAPPSDLPAMRSVPGVAVAYDYPGAKSRSAANSAVVRMVIQGGALQGSATVNVRGKITNLRNTVLISQLSRDVAVKDGGVIDFTVHGLDADTVYRIDGVQIQDLGGSGASQKVSDSYYMITAENTKLARAKRFVAHQALSEAYDWDRGNYDSSKGYTPGAWCDYFYTWALSKDFKIGRGYASTAFFRSYNALHDGQGIHELGKTRSLTGDLVRYEGTREGTHTFMILSYDTATGKLFTIEGNFNRRVMRHYRNVNSPWMHGHLVESQVR